ncbi:MAG TPA: hypothetical protein VHW69_11845 [Rhizomicrobium sp.]|nr:hypothetical protein [Rhizomicrobium sp.]
MDITKTASGYYAPTDANVVEILKTVPTRKYVELGTVTVTGFDVGDVAKMHNAVRTKAAVLGADAVILTQEGIIDHSFAPTERWATGVAIHYTDAQAESTPSSIQRVVANEPVQATSPSPTLQSVVAPEHQSFDQWQHSTHGK